MAHEREAPAINLTFGQAPAAFSAASTSTDLVAGNRRPSARQLGPLLGAAALIGGVALVVALAVRWRRQSGPPSYWPGGA
jgi:hypothetical protein